MLTFAPFRSLAAPLCAVALALVAAPAAHAQIFSNNAPISIPTQGIAAPYPSTIGVAGVVGTPAGLRVRLKNFSHTFPADVAVLLVAPSGQGIELLSRNGSYVPVGGLTLTFGAESATPLPQTLATGTFAPAGGNSGFAAPANAIPRAASLGAFIAGSPNGQWRLFVQDFVDGDSGSITSGWELEFGDFGGLPTTPSAPSTFTYQGRLEGGVTTGTINARFSLWSHPSINLLANSLAAPVTVSGIAVTDGLFTTPVNLGVPVPADIQTWLQVEISSPAGAPFVTLTPRQPITATPLAGAAQRAVLADSMPWSGLTGQASVPGSFGVGTATPGARMEINAGGGDGLLVRTSNSSPWALRIGNDVSTAAGFQTGMYMTDNGFFRITNRIANPNGTYAQLGTNGAWTALSDARLKTDVTTADGNLAAALKLRPVNFRWKSDGSADFGLIAQEVRAVLPKLVTGDESKDSLTLNYSQLSVVAIGAIQELKADNDALKARIVALENTVTQSAVTQSGMTRTQAAGLGAGVVLPLLVIAAFRRRKS